MTQPTPPYPGPDGDPSPWQPHTTDHRPARSPARPFPPQRAAGGAAATRGRVPTPTYRGGVGTHHIRPAGAAVPPARAGRAHPAGGAR